MAEIEIVVENAEAAELPEELHETETLSTADDSADSENDIPYEDRVTLAGAVFQHRKQLYRYHSAFLRNPPPQMSSPPYNFESASSKMLLTKVLLRNFEKTGREHNEEEKIIIKRENVYTDRLSNYVERQIRRQHRKEMREMYRREWRLNSILLNKNADEEELQVDDSSESSSDESMESINMVNNMNDMAVEAEVNEGGQNVVDDEDFGQNMNNNNNDEDAAEDAAEGLEEDGEEDAPGDAAVVAAEASAVVAAEAAVHQSIRKRFSEDDEHQSSSKKFCGNENEYQYQNSDFNLIEQMRNEESDTKMADELNQAQHKIVEDFNGNMITQRYDEQGCQVDGGY